jgi:hypothetical protein
MTRTNFNGIDRNMTAAEEAAYEIAAAQMAADEQQTQAAQDAKTAARASALTKLANLGLTDDEISALVG